MTKLLIKDLLREKYEKVKAQFKFQGGDCSRKMVSGNETAE